MIYVKKQLRQMTSPFGMYDYLPMHPVNLLRLLTGNVPRCELLYYFTLSTARRFYSSGGESSTQAFSQGTLKEGVQFWYNDTSTVKRGGGGGSRKRSSGKPLKFTLLHVSICSKLVRNFSNTLGFVSLCR